MAVKSLKTSDTHPYLVEKPYLNPDDQPKFRYFKEAQTWLRRDITKFGEQFKRLNDSGVKAAVDDLVEQVNALQESGGVVSGVIDPYTQMMYTAEVVKRG